MQTILTYTDPLPAEKIPVRLKRADAYTLRQEVAKAGIPQSQFIREGIAMRIAAGKFILPEQTKEAA